MNKGALNYNDYFDLKDNKNIIFSNLTKENQIQPSSIDLTLSSYCYEINSSFLSIKKKVKDKLSDYSTKKIDLTNGFAIKKDKIYLIKLNEKLCLPESIFGKCNPKSSTGRLDIFCRTIMNFSDEYEKIPFGYKGDIFLEVTSRSFDIFLKKGDSLNQMRLVNLFNNYISDKNLSNFHSKYPIIFENNIYVKEPLFELGLKIGVDLNNKDEVIAYKAKNFTPVLNFSQKNNHKISDFWKPIRAKKKHLTICPKEFFILKSKQKIRVPKNMAAEMIPYDTSLGDFRVHYAGFFDPGFGDPNGSFAVMEVRTNEVPFNLEDGQNIARLVYEKLNKPTKVAYGSNINSNYQNQGLALSKHFNIKSK